MQEGQQCPLQPRPLVPASERVCAHAPFQYDLFSLCLSPILVIHLSCLLHWLCILVQAFSIAERPAVPSAATAFGAGIWAGLCAQPFPGQCFLTVPFSAVAPPSGITSEVLMGQSMQDFRARPLRLYFRGQVRKICCTCACSLW